MTDYPLVYVVVLNYRNFSDTIECVRSVEKITYPNYRIVIVDNASDNESETVLKESFPRHLVLQAGRNGGYAAGNNVGIRRGIRDGADFFPDLNNDTVVEPDFVSVLVPMPWTIRRSVLSGPLIRQTNGEIYRLCARRRPRLRDVFWDKGIGRWFGGNQIRRVAATTRRTRTCWRRHGRSRCSVPACCFALAWSRKWALGRIRLFGEEFILREKIAPRGTRPLSFRRAGSFTKAANGSEPWALERLWPTCAA